MGRNGSFPLVLCSAFKVKQHSVIAQDEGKGET